MTDRPDGGKDESGDETLGEGCLEEGDDAGHALPEADLQYPTIEFDEGELDEGGGFDLSKATGREEMSAVATDLAGALASHDLCVETEEGVTTLGVAPEAVEATFDPDDDHRGDLEVTFRLSAAAMFVADDAAETVGARGGKGFVPLSMLTGDRDQHRCYGWIDDPGDPD